MTPTESVFVVTTGLCEHKRFGLHFSGRHEETSSECPGGPRLSAQEVDYNLASSRAIELGLIDPSEKHMIRSIVNAALGVEL